MYFDGVNRGLQFTKAGFYTTGLVMVLGFVATGSGYNGFFMALGFGLSLLVVSGLLSEKAMQHAECLGLASLSAEPAQPFTVRFFVRNRSRSWHVFAIDYSVSAALPKFGLLTRKFRSLMEAHVSALGPSERIECAGSCQGLGRGVYREFFLVQSTLFPFGLLLKFKVQKISCRIRILPTWNAEVAAELKEKLVRQLSMGDGQEFWSHRPILPSDSLRTVDWKKNAGLPATQWAVKVFRQNAETPTILLRWTDWIKTGDAADYESQLSAVRTAAETIASLGLTVLLETEPRRYYVDLESIFERLSAAPQFVKKHESAPAPISELPSGNFAVLRLRPNDRGVLRWEWETGSHAGGQSA